MKDYNIIFEDELTIGRVYNIKSWAKDNVDRLLDEGLSDEKVCEFDCYTSLLRELAYTGIDDDELIVIRSSTMDGSYNFYVLNECDFFRD